jgi:hypothetical protein
LCLSPVAATFLAADLKNLYNVSGPQVCHLFSNTSNYIFLSVTSCDALIKQLNYSLCFSSRSHLHVLFNSLIASHLLRAQTAFVVTRPFPAEPMRMWLISTRQ